MSFELINERNVTLTRIRKNGSQSEYLTIRTYLLQLAGQNISASYGLTMTVAPRCYIFWTSRSISAFLN